MAARGVYTLVFSTWPVIRIPQKCLSLTHQSMPMSPYYSLINLFVHLKVSEVLAIVVKKSLLAFRHSSRHKHHLDFKDKHFFPFPHLTTYLGLVHWNPSSCCLWLPKPQNQILADPSSMIPHLHIFSLKQWHLCFFFCFRSRPSKDFFTLPVASLD